MRVVRSEPRVQTKALRLTRKWYKPLINTYDVVCIFFYFDKFEGEGRGDFGHEYDKAANILANLYPRERHQKGQAIMVKVNCSDERVLCEMFNIWSYPRYCIIKNGELLEAGDPTERNTECFLQYVEQFIDNKKERPTEANRSRVVRFPIFSDKITLANYKNFVSGYDFVFIFFYATWYQSCKDALPLFEMANEVLSNTYFTTYNSTKYSANPPVLSLIRMNAGTDPAIVKKFGIRKYPTFKLVIQGRVCAEYKYDGTVEGFVNFIKHYIEKSMKNI